MKCFFVLLFLYSFNIWGQIKLNNENYYSNFPIEKMILGEWFLEKIEIIGLNKNDSSSIVALESGKDKIVFYEKTYKTFLDTTETKFYSPNYTFFYKIKKDQYHVLNQILITDKKNKKTIETYTILLYTFNHLTIEDLDVNTSLGNTVFRVRYYYKRKTDNEPTIIGKWILNDTADYYLPSANDSVWHTFYSSKKSEKDSLKYLREKTEIEFKTENNYSVGFSHSDSSLRVLDGVYLGGTYIIDSNENKLYFISEEIYVYEFEFDIEGNLKIRYLKKK